MSAWASDAFIPLRHRATSGRLTRTNWSSIINLKGRWLKMCGFIAGMPMTVTVERGRIIIETQINL
ncbi:type I toxin-antitoxin system SymE family toxin [Pectobacterium parmentieri]|uniref:SymE family type I addiction module toxin n=1 Tax=Pectobacterium parmentieri TaxID=1905730 RepID=UPI000CDDB761|nr:type I addiction module toxin, SymE family [Pectobacterium parmentieri]AYH07723.1 type I addiction module toxin, SymE family [Pectobacterium parmentieri]AYH16476.1 type I addiction module toxin, SymE family [Pectobacterium parmentieri]AYH20916.1 type I addiction module toxin, SymE family [Pectobacterium parmentieri]AYH25176.1 type I addiction module toxin, SymE family [Pectobacterium parmentieri]